MAGKLFFSFASGLDLALDQANLTGNPVIRFGSGFDMFKITNSAALTTVPASEVPVGSEPILQFDLSSDLHFPPLKRKAAVVPTPRAHVASTTVRPTARTTLSVQPVPVPTTVPVSVLSVPASDVTTSVPASAASKGKAVMIDEDDGLPVSFFEVGTTSVRTALTRSQRRNRSRRTRRHRERQMREAEVLALKDEKAPSLQVSPLPVENRFHLLSDTDGEEGPRRIAAVSPPPVVRGVPPPSHRPSTTGFRSVLRRLGRDSGRS